MAQSDSLTLISYSLIQATKILFDPSCSVTWNKRTLTREKDSLMTPLRTVGSQICALLFASTCYFPGVNTLLPAVKKSRIAPSDKQSSLLLCFARECVHIFCLQLYSLSLCLVFIVHKLIKVSRLYSEWMCDQSVRVYCWYLLFNSLCLFVSVLQICQRRRATWGFAMSPPADSEASAETTELNSNVFASSR